jgi:glutamate racemase
VSRSGDSRPIGVFDSGVGGLTVLTELRRRLPDERFVYLGDNARTPYGPRDRDEVRRFTAECVQWLLAQDIKLLLLACNTATAQALDPVREMTPVPVLGVIRPGAVAVTAATRTGHVGVIATAGTVASGAYAAAISEADPRLAIQELACPELVPLVEGGDLDGPRTRDAVVGYLDTLMAEDRGIDTLLLGCTHYPLLRPLIEAHLGRDVAVVDSAFTTAVAVEDLLDALGMRAVPGSGGVRVATTGSVDAFRAVAVRLFGDALPEVEAVDTAASAVSAARG